VSVVALEGTDRVARSEHVPLSVLAIYARSALVYLASSRFIISATWCIQEKRRRRPKAGGHLRRRRVRRAVVLGLLGGPDFSPVPLSTTSDLCHGRRINAIKVYGRDALADLVRDFRIGGVLWPSHGVAAP